MTVLYVVGGAVLIFVGLPLLVLLGGFGPEDTLAKEDRDNGDY